MPGARTPPGRAAKVHALRVNRIARAAVSRVTAPDMPIPHFRKATETMKTKATVIHKGFALMKRGESIRSVVVY